MQSLRTLSVALILGYSALGLTLGQAQAPPRESVSSDDISVAEGLQLPTYGHIWALDTWKGVRELVRLKPPDTTAEPGFSFKLHHNIEFKGEAALVRVHDTAPLFFLRGVSGSDNGRSDLVVIRLNIEGERREASKDAMAQLKQQAKHADAQYPDVIGIQQQRVGTTDWYRLSPRQVLAPGEYALVPLPDSPVSYRPGFQRCDASDSAGKLRPAPLRNRIAAANESHTPITPKCESVSPPPVTPPV